MKITLWGTRGSVPVSGPGFLRHGGSTTCLCIEPEFPGPSTPERIIIDCGTGIAELGRTPTTWHDTLVLQTHLHWDHVQGFPFFGGLFQPAASFHFLAVDRDGETLREVLDAQMSRPTFPVGLDVLPARLDFESIEPSGMREFGEVTVTWAEMVHPSGSTAFRIEADGATFVFSGDIEAAAGSAAHLVELARGADVLVMDAQYFPAEYATRKGWGHSTPCDAVDVAAAAGVGRLVLTHHDPAHDDARLEEKLVVARERANGRVIVDNAYDRMTIELSCTGRAAAA